MAEDNAYKSNLTLDGIYLKTEIKLTGPMT